MPNMLPINPASDMDASSMSPVWDNVALWILCILCLAAAHIYHGEKRRKH